MLALHLAQIGRLRLAVALPDAQGLARDDVMAEIVEEILEIGVAGRLGDGAVEVEIGGDRRLAARDRGIDLAERGRDALELARRAPLGGEAGGEDLDAHAQLHDAQYVGQRFQPLGVDAEGAALDIGGDEGADALAGQHQPLRAQRRDGLADHRPADPETRHHRLLGGQPRAGRQLARSDLGGKQIDQLDGEVLRRRERPKCGFPAGHLAPDRGLPMSSCYRTMPLAVKAGPPRRARAIARA